MKVLIFIVAAHLILINCKSNEDKNKENDKMDSQTVATLETINKFNDAFNRHDVDEIMSLMTEDVVFENTRPAPDGERYVGQESVRAFWIRMFERSPEAKFEAEEIFACGDRCVMRWIYNWVREGRSGHIRGIDVFKVRDGKVAEKFSYVKG